MGRFLVLSKLLAKAGGRGCRRGALRLSSPKAVELLYSRLVLHWLGLGPWWMEQSSSGEFSVIACSITVLVRAAADRV